MNSATLGELSHSLRVSVFGKFQLREKDVLQLEVRAYARARRAPRRRRTVVLRYYSAFFSPRGDSHYLGPGQLIGTFQVHACCNAKDLS